MSEEAIAVARKCLELATQSYYDHRNWHDKLIDEGTPIGPTCVKGCDCTALPAYRVMMGIQKTYPEAFK